MGNEFCGWSETMKIGVLIATYNGEKFIKEQLDSIINQTTPVNEIIISDDGSMAVCSDLRINPPH